MRFIAFKNKNTVDGKASVHEFWVHSPLNVGNCYNIDNQWLQKNAFHETENILVNLHKIKSTVGTGDLYETTKEDHLGF